MQAELWIIKSFKPTFLPERLSEPLEVKKPSKIFVCSVSDLFASWTPRPWMWQVLYAIWSCDIPHTFQLLTKNPELIPKRPYYQDNVWVGTTVTCQGDLKNIEEIKQIKARVRFVSFEPLLGALPEDCSLKGIDWVIVGKLTGSKKVKLKFEWLASILS